MPRTPLAAGIDIGGTKISAVLTDDGGRRLAFDHVPAPAAAGGPAMADAAAALVRRLEAEAGVAVGLAGVGAAGVIDQRTGTVVAASATFADWAGFPLGSALADRLGVPVAVDNDVNAFLVGELRWGAARGQADVLGVMLGTGVGGAIALDGRLFAGHRGAAGEIGHTPGYSELVCTCGRVGHLETLASGRSIEARYAERTGAAAPTVRGSEIADRARAGEPDALAVFDAAGRAVGLAASSAASMFDLSFVVVGGGVRAAWDLLEPAVRAGIDGNPPVSGFPLEVRPAELGADGVVLGAAALAFSDAPHTTPAGAPAPTALVTH
ncbi:ROK family protein [Agromyces soli]|uniref:ROK family protein n=1 Tax=Agromyces soli TaxID=659012 RepID=A0ABY4ASG1_9MICO|nr:ROK family protein [Agromyces soli]UOE25096.1 ROK family protein [Agromyces soli]